MIAGWILFSCALIILAIMACAPQRRNEQTRTMEKQIFGTHQHFSARLDELDACLVRRDEVISYLSSGQKIKAIKLYREDTGASLADARAAVERMEQTFGLGGASLAQEMQQESLSVETNALTSEVERLLRQGQKIKAIKLYREQIGVGLREAKARVDHIESTLLPGRAAFAPSQVTDPETEGRIYAAREPDEEIRQVLLQGNKIKAIKLYREQTGLGLREAKEAIDRLEQTLHYGMEQA